MRLCAAWLAALHAAGAGAAATDWCETTDRLTALSFDWDTNVTQQLRNRTLRVVAFHEPPWAVVNHSLPAGYGPGTAVSGFEVELMMRIAKEGGFNLEYDGKIVGENESWTDALLEAKDKYDIVAGGGWMDTSQRRRMGIIFTTEIENLGVVLAMRKPKPVEPTVWENAFFWVKPFTGTAYVVVALFAILPAGMLWHLEKEDQPGVEGAIQSQFMGVLAVVGFGDFTWGQRPLSRGVMLLWAIVCLVLVSSYTASLTSFLVVSANPEVGVADTEDFFLKGKKACVPAGWGVVEQIETKWAEFRDQMVPVQPSMMSKSLVGTEECDGILMQYDYARVMLEGGPPSTPPPEDRPDYGCDSVLVGPTEIAGVGAFPAGLTNCSWFVVHVVDAIVRVLAEQNVVEDFFLEAVSDATRLEDGSSRCPASSEEEGEGEVVITAGHLAGLVLIVLPLMFAITIAGMVLDPAAEGGGDDDDDFDASDERAALGLAAIQLGGEWLYGPRSYSIVAEGGKLMFKQGMQAGEMRPAAGWTAAPNNFQAQWRAELPHGIIWFRYDKAKTALHSIYREGSSGQVWRCTAYPPVSGSGSRASLGGRVGSLGGKSPTRQPPLSPSTSLSGIALTTAVRSGPQLGPSGRSGPAPTDDSECDYTSLRGVAT